MYYDLNTLKYSKTGADSLYYSYVSGHWAFAEKATGAQPIATPGLQGNCIHSEKASIHKYATSTGGAGNQSCASPRFVSPNVTQDILASVMSRQNYTLLHKLSKGILA